MNSLHKMILTFAPLFTAVRLMNKLPRTALLYFLQNTAIMERINGNFYFCPIQEISVGIYFFIIWGFLIKSLEWFLVKSPSLWQRKFSEPKDINLKTRPVSLCNISLGQIKLCDVVAVLKLKHSFNFKIQINVGGALLIRPGHPELKWSPRNCNN